MSVSEAGLPEAARRLIFNLDGRAYRLGACILLHRQATDAAAIGECLVLTPDLKLALIEPVGRLPAAGDFLDAVAPALARRLTPRAARFYLIAAGEADLIDDFPDLFGERVAEARPRRPEQPSLFTH